MDEAKETAARVAELTGWTPPVVYDLACDSYRIATQADIDRLTDLCRAYSSLLGTLRGAVQEADTANGRIRATIT